MPSWCSPNEAGSLLRVVVVPRASRTDIAGEHGDALRIRLAAPPVDGAANDELVAFLAKRLHLRRAAIRITAGETARRKTLELAGIGPDLVVERLLR